MDMILSVSFFKDLFVYFIRISKVDTMAKTDIVSARRDKPVIHPVTAQVAFLGYALIGIKGNGVIRTSLNTGLATGAFLFIQKNNTVLSLFNGFFRARLHTLGVITVPAHVNLEDKIQRAVHHTETIFPNAYQLDAVC